MPADCAADAIPGIPPRPQQFDVTTKAHSVNLHNLPPKRKHFRSGAVTAVSGLLLAARSQHSSSGHARASAPPSQLRGAPLPSPANLTLSHSRSIFRQCVESWTIHSKGTRDGTFKHGTLVLPAAYRLRRGLAVDPPRPCPTPADRKPVDLYSARAVDLHPARAGAPESHGASGLSGAPITEPLDGRARSRTAAAYRPPAGPGRPAGSPAPVTAKRAHLVCTTGGAPAPCAPGPTMARPHRLATAARLPRAATLSACRVLPPGQRQVHPDN